MNKTTPSCTFCVQYFEQDDAELYVSKIKFILENDVTELQLTFTQEVYRDGKLSQVRSTLLHQTGSMLCRNDKALLTEDVIEIGNQPHCSLHAGGGPH